MQGFKEYISSQKEESFFIKLELDKLSNFFIKTLKIKMPDTDNYVLPYHWIETNRRKHGFSIGIINRQTLEKNREIGIEKSDFNKFKYFIKVSERKEEKVFDFLDQALLELRNPALKIIEVNRRSKEDFEERKKLMRMK